MEHKHEYISTSHGCQNYHRPRRQLFKKEDLVGPVTAVALLSLPSEDDSIDLSTEYSQAFLVARGPFVNITFDDLMRKTTCRFLAFSDSDGGTVHGMKKCVGTINVEGRNVQLWLFYGGRKVALVTVDLPAANSGCDDGYSPFTNIPILDNQDRLKESYIACDWIWDVRAIRVEDPIHAHGENSEIPFRVLTALGLAHNSVEIQALTSNTNNGKVSVTQKTIRKIVCDVRCITYSLNFFGWMPIPSNKKATDNMDLAVVVGTVSNEILVWNVIDKNENPFEEEGRHPVVVRKKVLHCLSGHQGVIHSVKVGFGARYLVSTSDDRTVRLWAKSGHDEHDGDQGRDNFYETHQDVKKLAEEDFSLLWTAYGHSARVWDSDFISLKNDAIKSRSGIVTVGEDSTIRLWGIDDGSELAILRGHGCQNIWKVASSNSGTILTGGNDGTAKIYDVSHQLIHNSYSEKASFGGKGLTPTMRLVDIPEDEEPKNNIEAPTSHSAKDDDIAQTCQEPNGKKKKKKKKHIPNQTICGTCFYFREGSRTRNLMVSTRSGNLFSIDLKSFKWTKHGSWSKQNEGNEQLVDSTKGSCIAVHSNGRMVAVGTSKGEIILSPIAVRALKDKVLFSVPQYPAIQSLHWLGPDNLLSFHIKGIVVWWTCFSSTIEQPKIRFVLSMAKDGLNLGIPMSYCYNEKLNFMYIGDSRGNIAVFDCIKSEDSGCIRKALDVLPYTHKKEHVTCIIPSLNGRGILSVGNDGFIHEATTKNTKDGIKLCSIIRRSVPCLTGITHIWHINRNELGANIVVAGYHGNKFIVWDQSDGYQLLSLDTGGRNRQLDLGIEFHSGLQSTSHDIAIVIANKSSANQLILHTHNPLYRRQYPSQYNLGQPCHGETILDVTFCATSSADRKLLVSVSNDCTAKLYLVEENETRFLNELQPHESCIRAVCSSQHDGSKSSLLVTTGGKLLSTFYRIDESEDGTFTTTFLCNNILQKSAGIDQRMNAVDAVPLNKAFGHNSHLVVSGDSDGGLHLATITEEIGQPRRLATFKLGQEYRPILSIRTRKISDENILLCVGNTAGDVAIWILPGSNEIDPTSLPKTPLYVYKGNQVGTNCIDFSFFCNDEKCPKVLIVSGGDDQAISCSIIGVNLSSTHHSLSIASEVITFREACASAIKGISIAGNVESGYRVFTAGYDNRLSIWSLNSFQHLTFISSTAIDVKDVNALDCCVSKDHNGVEKDLVVVGAEGTELFSFDINLWKAAKALKKCNYLLITCGAGFSADSGLSTYENMPDSYREMCNPLRLVDRAPEFQRFWHNFSQVYQKTDPHYGYNILEQWCNGQILTNLLTAGDIESRDKVDISPWWIYSSNVDGHFSRSKCFSDTICEIHGNANSFRCSSSIGTSNGQKRQGALWDSWNKRVVDSTPSDGCASNIFLVTDETSSNIRCKHCLLPARPNVLLFHDTDAGMIDFISNHRDRYQKWESRIENDVVQNNRKLVILELGAGLNVPAVREETEDVFHDTVKRLNESGSEGEVTCIRINSRDAGFDSKEGAEHTISIYDKAENALLNIDHILNITR